MSWIQLLLGGSGAALGSGGLLGVALKQLKRSVSDAVAQGVKPVADDLTALKLKLAAETGGNSNGLRQKVNEVDSKVDALAADFAEVKGFIKAKVGQGL